MSSINEEILRIETAKADIEDAIEECGVDVPDTELISTYASYIRQIPNTVLNEADGRYVLKAGDTMTGALTLYSTTGDSPHLIFQRGETNDGVYDWDQYVTQGYLKIRYNNSGTWKEILSLFPGNNTLEGYKILTAANYTSYVNSTNFPGLTKTGTVTSVATGTGLTGGNITTSGTISINSTYQTYISNGNIAYSWGNHADAGYIKSRGYIGTTAVQESGKVQDLTGINHASLSGRLTINTSVTDHANPLNQCLVINSTAVPSGTSLTLKNSPGIGFHVANRSWGSLVFDGAFKFINNDGSGYMNVHANSFVKSGSDNNYVLLGGGGHKSLSNFVQTNSEMIKGTFGKIPTYAGESGWHRIATIDAGSFGYGSYILYLCGSWSNNANTTAIIHVNTMHTTSSLTQVSGIVGFINKVRLVHISANNYYVDVHINHPYDNTPGQVYFYFLGNGDISTNTTAEKITDSVTASSEISLATIGKLGTVTSVAVANGGGIGISGSPVTSSGTITLANTGVRSLTIGTGDNNDKLVVNTNGSTSYLTIPYATTATTARSLGSDDTMKLYAQYGNEINFGGTTVADTIYIGYRATGNKLIPSTFIFGGSTGSAALKGKKFISTAEQGIAPFTVTSTTKVANLNADLIDGYDSTSLVRKSVMENNSSFNANNMTADLTIYTPKGDVGTRAASWSNFPTTTAPAGGFSLFNIKEGSYNRQIYGAYAKANLYTRYQYYSGTSTVWSDWKTIACLSDITKSNVGLGNVQNTAFYRRNTTVNGTTWAMAGTTNNATFTIYAPTTAGTSGQVLIPGADGKAPVWSSTLTIGTTTSTVQTPITIYGTGDKSFVKFTSGSKVLGYLGFSAQNTPAWMTNDATETIPLNTKVTQTHVSNSKEYPILLAPTGQTTTTTTTACFNQYITINPSTGIISAKIQDTDVQWSTEGISGNVMPLAASLCDPLRGNRFAGIKAEAVTIEYSTNAGSSWTDYGASSEAKRSLFTYHGSSFTLGKNTSKSASNNHRLRITIDCNTGSVYTKLNKALMNVSTEGSSNCTVTIQVSNNNSTYTDKGTYNLNGWSGYNEIPFKEIVADPQARGNNYFRYIRFLFSANYAAQTGDYYGLRILSIQVYGGFGWTTPNNYIAKYGTPYTYNYLGNTTFMGSVITSDITGKSGILYISSYNTSYSIQLRHGTTNKLGIGSNIVPYANIVPDVAGSRQIGDSDKYFERIYGRYFDTASGYDLRLCTGGTERVQVVAADGSVKIHGSLYAQDSKFYTNANGAYWTSDRRFKTNIHNPVKSGLLQDPTGYIRKFNWKDTGVASYGYIAQELLSVIPEAVDYDETLNKYSVNYDVAHSAIIGQLVIKIKELEEEIKLLKAKFN